MNPDKDYYAVLGVLFDAEDLVVRAVYRALAQRYHPDRAGGLQDGANIRMAELNEAYGVLSDVEKRQAYDQVRKSTMCSGGSQLSNIDETPPPGKDPLEKDWRIALKYYPDLALLEKRLSQFSWKLANTYRAYLLETQQFEPREHLASRMENHFLGAYFGDNEKIAHFARTLILAKQRKAAVALNESIRVLGSNTDPRRVIARIARDFDIRHLAVNKERICSLLSAVKASAEKTSVFTQMLQELGGTVACDGDTSIGGKPGRSAASKGCMVEFDGRDFSFPSENAFRAWFTQEVLPIAEQLAI